MWRRLLISISCILFFPGCALDNHDTKMEQAKGEIDMNEQLLEAVEHGDTDIISSLMKEGVDINTQDSEGRTAAMIATYHNDVESMKMLIDAGADVNIQDDMENNPFLYAGAEGFLDILKLTIEVGADPTVTNRYGGTALIPAAEHGYVDVVEELLTNTDIDVNHVNNLGWTALLEAIILNNGDEKQQQTVQLLIDHGADVHIADNGNVTPLQHAHEKGFKEIEQILLEAGAE
ncbi:ankyrin repeat domain-containing protein [Pseudogracilibacillus auburnensis]|uniref:ankyrin repeat domain-containing protein n=1 Tax=Pseudogracilibacillus auburnensis TaxID=1494959 RepID=UPI001A958743|nr:ankyrin repeat domain-containing protein [Pseudogracilibacillus auburnensis]MBO1003904.1 ankyrin repeat domain-containing protein [Pseudogracilibacillus auburnensis]